jgi:hypothetical protein
VRREVITNIPDVIIKNKNVKTCVLVDVAIPADRNVTQKQAEKYLPKYKRLCVKIQRMSNMKCMIISVIIRANGILTGSLKKFRSHTNKHAIDSVQKTATLGVSHKCGKYCSPKFKA